MTFVLLLAVGGFCLYIGAEWLVRGASGLAMSLGVKPMIIGLTVVAYGTSAPELAVGIGSALSHQGAIALGNSIGSNIANIGLILGITAILSPPHVDPAIRRVELPVLVLSTLAIPLVLLDGRISRVEAGFLFCAAIAYSAFTIRYARATRADLEALQEATEVAGAPQPKKRSMLALTSAIGLLALLGGGKLFVEGAVGIARLVGMSDRLVGLTVVAIGTSVPELATSIIAARRGHSDLAVGNVVGSNIFNTLLILGAAGMAGSIEAPLKQLWLDLGALAVFTAMGSWAMLQSRISRRAGAVLLATYVLFLFLLVMGVGGL